MELFFIILSNLISFIIFIFLANESILSLFFISFFTDMFIARLSVLQL